MKRLAFVFILLLLSAKIARAQSLPFPGPGGFFGGGASSNIVLVQQNSSTNANCRQSGATGNFTCATSATGTGNLLVVINFQYSGTGPSAPTSTHNTFTQACQPTGDAGGAPTVYYAANSVAGDTSITINAGAHPASAIFSEWSGVATSSPLDLCNSTLLSNSASTTFYGVPLTGTQTDLAIGCDYNRANGTDTYSAADVWTALASAPQTSDGDQGFCEYVVNGVKSQYVPNGTINNARTSFGWTALFKSSVAGSFTGQTPTTFLSMAGTNGNPVTMATFPSNPSIGSWTFGVSGDPNGCFHFTNANGLAALTTNATNGTQYFGGGTNAISYDLACNGATDNQIGVAIAAGSGTKMSALLVLRYPNTAALDNFAFGGFVSAGSTDRCYPDITSPDGVNYYVFVETAGGDSSHTGIDISSYVASNAPIAIATQIDTGTGLTCQAEVIDGATGLQVGSTVSHAVAAGTPISWTFGRFDSGVATGTLYFIRGALDTSGGGTFPLKP